MNIENLIEKAFGDSGIPEDLKGNELFFRAALELEKKSSRSEAEILYRAALEKNPGHLPSLVNLADICKSTGRISEAFSLLAPAAAAGSSVSEVHEALGNILTASGKTEEALAEYNKALALSPCKMRPIANKMLSMNYMASLSQSEIFAAHAEAAKSIESSVKRFIHEKKPINGQKIRVGFVSADLKRHSVTFFLEPVLALLDRNDFEIFLYSDTINCDSISSRIKTYGTWRDITTLGDEESAALIQVDNINILIDLSGHTGIRMRLFAMKPAPVQISWLGYPNTTGLSAMDWRISDEWADPRGQEAFHSEKLLRIPGGFQVYAPPADAPELSEMPCLKNSYITFGSFNSLPKINKSVIQIWARILKSVPGSKLFLKAYALADNEVRDYFAALFRDEGIEEKRLSFSGMKGTLNEHLAEYSKVDLALDTFPYNGATTSCEALWMGVPVLTLAGERHAGRVGVSLLKRLGLESFITETKSSYIANARAAALNQEVLKDLRRNLRNIMASSSLCDAESFTRKFGAALKSVYPSSHV